MKISGTVAKMEQDGNKMAKMEPRENKMAKTEPDVNKMAKMEPDAENNNFKVEGKYEYEAQDEDKTVKQARKSEVPIDTLRVHPAVQAMPDILYQANQGSSAVPDILYPAIQGYSAVPDILASFRRTLGPKATALHGACSEM